MALAGLSIDGSKMLLLTQSRLVSSLRALKQTWRSHGGTNPARVEEPLFGRLSEVVRHTWYLGFTSFGGPPVHFQIFHARFVEKEKWVDEQTVGAICLIGVVRTNGCSIKSSSPYVRDFQDQGQPKCCFA